MKLTGKSALIIAVVVLVAAAFALAAFLVYPKWQKLGELDSQIAEAKQQAQQAQSLLEQRQAVKAKATETDAELLRLSNELPESPELPSLIIQLQDTTNEAGVDFISLTPGEPTQNSGYSAVALKLVIAGSWADVIDFMHRASELTRQVRTVGYVVSPIAPAEGSTDSQRVSVTVDLEVYTLAPTQTAGTGVPPAPAQ